MTERPDVSVVLPFFGDAAEADAALAALATLQLRPGDELLVADNSAEGVLVQRPGAANVSAFVTGVKRSAYAARNEAVERARNDWLLLLDADCRPQPDLLDHFLEPAPGPGVGAIAGQVLGDPGQPGRVPAYVRSRGHLDQQWLAEQHPFRPMAVTANLLLRREAWASVGGFAEQTQSGADADFCWRLQDAGWELELRTAALVHHEHRSTLRGLLRQARRDGRGGRWLARRWPGFEAHPRLRRELPRSTGGALAWLAIGRPRRALFKLIDGAWVLANALGSLEGNAPGASSVRAAEVALLDAFPGRDDPLLGELGGPSGLRVEAARRPARTDWERGRALPASLAEDDGPATRLAALLWLTLRRPVRLVAARPGRAGATPLRELAPVARRLAKDGRDVRLTVAPARAADGQRLARLVGLRQAPRELVARPSVSA